MRHVVLFDGVCNFCNATINFVIDHDRANRFVFAPLQSEAGRQLLQTNGLDAAKLDSVVLLKNGVVHQKSDAALQIVRELDGPWSLLYVFRILPRFLRNFAYDILARNRYRWFGRRDSCRMPTPELRQRFLA
ncbi:MAG: thiol-disulfide oxidoreductase DCC family protein [Ferruginibacter sp.]|nr:thiol-disulfide oxidoreductase DCC family protein [Cytophagales bacterium]